MPLRPQNQDVPVRPILRLGLVGIAAALSASSIWVVELSIPAILLTLVAGVALPKLSSNMRHAALAAVLASATAASVSLVRFASGKAMSGIVEAGQRATAKSAIWRLREVVLAEDGLRKAATIDPDRDGIGSAAWIGGLTGSEPLRHDSGSEPALLNYRYRRTLPTAAGLASNVGSHLILVCLPRAGGGFTSRSTETVDEEAAERRFLVYAWPSDEARDIHDVVFVDEHERILLLDLPKSPYRGTKLPPACDAALGGDGNPWKPWNDKKPRQRLPGDRGS